MFIRKQSVSLITIIIFILLSCSHSLADTIVEGDVSGTWDIAGSPYLFINDCTVQTGDVLVIDPGVEVVIGESLSLNVRGQIIAVGTKNDHITFRAVNNNVTFNQVYVLNGSTTPPVSEFEYCDFQNAQTGLYLHAYGRIDNDYTTLQTNVSKCNFASTVITAIYARAQAVDASQYMTPKRRHARVSPVIKGCVFDSNNVGIEMLMQGAGSAYYSHGTTDAIIQNNVFLNLSVAALNMLPASLNSGYPAFVNNTIVNSDRGVWIQDTAYDATMTNNIFYGTTTAIERVGTESSTAFYNCFFNNTTDFVGYPATYGDIVMSNANGDPCDLGHNIFLDPLFVSTANIHLTESSPCIDAGRDEGSPNDDIDGSSRPNGAAYDIGADEFSVITNLTANAGPDELLCFDICDGIVLDGRRSSPMNEIDVYSWELNHRDNAAFNATATGPTPTLSNLEYGIYDVILSITDDYGSTATDEMVLTVRETCNSCTITKGDLDADGDVDGDDLAIFSYYYGTIPLTP